MMDFIGSIVIFIAVLIYMIGPASVRSLAINARKSNVDQQDVIRFLQSCGKVIQFCFLAQRWYIELLFRTWTNTSQAGYFEDFLSFSSLSAQFIRLVCLSFGTLLTSTVLVSTLIYPRNFMFLIITTGWCLISLVLHWKAYRFGSQIIVYRKNGNASQ